MLFKAARTAVFRVCQAAARSSARPIASRRSTLRSIGALQAGTRQFGVGFLLSACVAVGGSTASAQQISAEVSVDTAGGFARMVYRFDGDVDANVRMSNGILVISFNVPVQLSVDRIDSIAGYVSAARRDPDGKGVSIAL